MLKKTGLFLLFFSVFFHLQAQECFFKRSAKKSAETLALIQNTQAYIETNQFAKAAQKLNLIHAVGKKTGDSLMLAAVNYQKAELYLSLHDYDGALISVERSIALQKLFPASDCLIKSYLLKSTIFLAQREFVLAEETFKKINTLAYSSEETTALKNLYSGKKWVMVGRPQKAFSPLKKALNYFQKKQQYFNQSESLYYLAKAYKKTGDFENAFQFGSQAKNLCLTQHYGLQTVKVFDIISDLYFSKKEFALAEKYDEQAKDKRDSIYYAENLAGIKNLKHLGNIENAAQTISKLTKENSKQKKILSSRKTALIMSAILLGFLALLSLAFLKNKNLRGDMNEILLEKNRKLLRAKEKAEAATKAKEEFLTTVTHELRTPVYAITGLTYLLLSENPSEGQKESLNSLKISGEHLQSLINNILDLNKLEAKKVQLIEKRFDVRKEMNDFVASLKNTASKKNVALDLQIDQKVPSHLKGDILRINQALINLVSNAIKFSKDGHVWIRLKLIEENENTAEIRFEIEDDGIGIPKNKQKKIFHKFDQGQKRTNLNYGGTGLGLSIVKNLLTYMGSTIHVESEEGEGSKFYFDLKFKKVKPIAGLQNELAQKDVVSTQEDREKLFAGKKLLVVEDNKLNQKITQRILEKQGIKSDVADNGSLALQMAQSQKYDLILMDIHMPEMDGIEASKAIREKGIKCPIIALTAVDIYSNSEKIDQFKFDDIISKPYQTEAFFHKIYTALAKQSKKE